MCSHYDKDHAGYMNASSSPLPKVSRSNVSALLNLQLEYFIPGNTHITSEHPYAYAVVFWFLLMVLVKAKGSTP